MIPVSASRGSRRTRSSSLMALSRRSTPSSGPPDFVPHFLSSIVGGRLGHGRVSTTLSQNDASRDRQCVFHRLVSATRLHLASGGPSGSDRRAADRRIFEIGPPTSSRASNERWVRGTGGLISQRVMPSKWITTIFVGNCSLISKRREQFRATFMVPSGTNAARRIRVRTLGKLLCGSWRAPVPTECNAESVRICTNERGHLPIRSNRTPDRGSDVKLLIPQHNTRH